MILVVVVDQWRCDELSNQVVVCEEYETLQKGVELRRKLYRAPNLQFFRSPSSIQPIVFFHNAVAVHVLTYLKQCSLRIEALNATLWEASPCDLEGDDVLWLVLVNS